jgi:hypothetical protein
MNETVGYGNDVLTGSENNKKSYGRGRDESLWVAPHVVS